ncbi:glycoside hydrolase, putative [Leishmania panamensis]|uniref:Glycoside hydrolase, putative n=1 Tax=Leishmania panamensis TaxID=5679 RepID=A0A088RLI3_LEIPA|nr:glycoside hydrolase, putative [Leishmania panamensis]AIN96054.1 glycoside hydrolase, putative [Leishmania panamensis]
MQRRRIRHHLRFVDRYIVFAVLGVVAYILVINLVAECLAIGIRDRTKTAVSSREASRVSDVVPDEVFWPHRWPVAPIAEVHIIKEAMEYVTQSLTKAIPFTKHLPEAQLAVWDLMLLTGVRTDLTPAVKDLKAVAKAALSTATGAASSETFVAVREALESAAVVWSMKGKTAEADEVRKVLMDIAAVPTPGATADTTSWSAFAREVWSRVAAGGASSTPDGILETYNTLRNASQSYWHPGEQAAAVPPLYNSKLLPLRAGTYDAVVPLARLFLQLWVLGGQRKADQRLVETYDAAVASILRDLLYTRTVTAEAQAVNFTFVGSRAELLVPVATPRMCALGGVLAQGVRYGAHRYPARPSTAQYSENDVLQAAEALTTSCFQLYAEPAGHKLRSAVYVTDSGRVPGYTHAGNGGGTASLRSSYCDIPAVLLESFYELYQTTHDPMYGLWAILVMRQDTSDHCGLRKTDVTSATLWRRHIRELRSLWLLFHHMECLVYRRSRGSRAMCELATTTMVSPVTGHIVPVPYMSATS